MFAPEQAQARSIWKRFARKSRRPKGPEFWRSLEELAGSAEFQEMMHREFPKGASEWLDSVSRRGFLKLMGASLAMAGMTACTKQPPEPIVPYVKQPEEYFPGGRFFTRLLLLLVDTPVRCWLKVISIVRPKLKATSSIRRAWAEPTSLRRLRSWGCTIPTARRPSRIWATCEPGEIFSRPSADRWTCRKACKARGFAS